MCFDDGDSVPRNSVGRSPPSWPDAGVTTIDGSNPAYRRWRWRSLESKRFRPEVARLRARLGGLALSASYDPREYTQKARATFNAKFEAEVDPHHRRVTSRGGTEAA